MGSDAGDHAPDEEVAGGGSVTAGLDGPVGLAAGSGEIRPFLEDGRADAEQPATEAADTAGGPAEDARILRRQLPPPHGLEHCQTAPAMPPPKALGDGLPAKGRPSSATRYSMEHRSYTMEQRCGRPARRRFGGSERCRCGEL